MRIDLSLRADYAVRAMVALAELDGQDLVSARVIAERMVIPASFLPHVLHDLVEAGLVVGRVGRTGGYRLAMPARDIQMLRILDAIDGDPGAPRCVLRGAPCNPEGRCDVHDIFAAATEALRASLAGATLADVGRATRG